MIATSKNQSKMLRNLKQPCLREYVKFVFFEDSALQRVQLRDLEEFNESQMQVYRQQTQEQTSGLDGMMEQLLSSMLGGDSSSLDGG